MADQKDAYAGGHPVIESREQSFPADPAESFEDRIADYEAVVAAILHELWPLDDLNPDVLAVFRWQDVLKRIDWCLLEIDRIAVSYWMRRQEGDSPMDRGPGVIDMTVASENHRAAKMERDALQRTAARCQTDSMLQAVVVVQATGVAHHLMRVSIHMRRAMREKERANG